MSLCELLCDSASRWATTALGAYANDPSDHDFAVHHMAVSVEHLSKAYLCSVNDVLIVCEKPTTDDLLILAGHKGREKGQSEVNTLGGEPLSKRVVSVLGRTPAGSSGLRRLREVRNGIAHLGLAADPADVRDRLVPGIEFLNDLLPELGRNTAAFWGTHMSLAEGLVEQTVTERQLRYESKLRKARENFALQVRGVPERRRAEATTALSSILDLYGPALYGCVVSVECPACGSPALVRGTEHSVVHDEGFTREWFSPEHFHCAVCKLTLEGNALDGGELELAGITGRYLPDYYEEDPE